MRTIVAAVSIVVLTLALAMQATPSSAQKGMGGGGRHGKGGDSAPAKKVDDKAYKAALDSLPNGKLDPWRNMR